MVIDKQSITIIAFIAVFGISAAILAMGAVPQIFRTAERTDTLETVLNESLIIKQQEEAFQKQAISDSMEREKQRLFIINETNKTVRFMGDELKQYINDSENRTEQAALERDLILENILEIGNQHDIESEEHAEIVTEAQNTTQHVEDELERYGENSIEAFQKIIDNQNEIINLIKNKP